MLKCMRKKGLNAHSLFVHSDRVQAGHEPSWRASLIASRTDNHQKMLMARYDGKILILLVLVWRPGSQRSRTPANMQGPGYKLLFPAPNESHFGCWRILGAIALIYTSSTYTADPSKLSNSSPSSPNHLEHFTRFPCHGLIIECQSCHHPLRCFNEELRMRERNVQQRARTWNTSVGPHLQISNM